MRELEACLKLLQLDPPEHDLLFRNPLKCLSWSLVNVHLARPIKPICSSYDAFRNKIEINKLK